MTKYTNGGYQESSATPSHKQPLSWARVREGLEPPTQLEHHVSHTCTFRRHRSYSFKSKQEKLVLAMYFL